MCLGVFGREIKERRERICQGKLPNTSSFFQNEGSGDIYTGKLILRLPMHLVGPLAHPAYISSFGFSLVQLLTHI